MTLRETLHFGEQFLAQQGIADASVDAWLLLEYVTGISRAQYLARAAEPAAADPEEAEALEARYRELLAGRAGHVPLQYLTGVQEFMGLPFLVNEHVLIPRQDTETLAEEALSRLKPGMRVLDLCTGSGCIAVSLAKLGPEYMRRQADDLSIRVDASDISPDALAAAGENVRRLNVQVQLYESDLFDRITGVYDMIVSNPPYIRTDVIGKLAEEVRLHEPHEALDGHGDGLFFYRKIARQSVPHLAGGGWLLLEIGYDQAEAVSGLLAGSGFEEITVVCDLAGHDRVVCARHS